MYTDFTGFQLFCLTKNKHIIYHYLFCGEPCETVFKQTHDPVRKSSGSKAVTSEPRKSIVPAYWDHRC